MFLRILLIILFIVVFFIFIYDVISSNGIENFSNFMSPVNINNIYNNTSRLDKLQLLQGEIYKGSSFVLPENTMGFTNSTNDGNINFYAPQNFINVSTYANSQQIVNSIDSNPINPQIGNLVVDKWSNVNLLGQLNVDKICFLGPGGQLTNVCLTSSNGVLNVPSLSTNTLIVTNGTVNSNNTVASEWLVVNGTANANATNSEYMIVGTACTGNEIVGTLHGYDTDPYVGYTNPIPTY